MPYSIEPSVTYWNGCYYFRTWFLEECETHQLFGTTDRYLRQLTGIHVPFRVGTLIYLDDAPYFKKNKKNHRVCGQYEIIPTEVLPPDATPIHVVDNSIIIYREQHPEKGPWLNRRVKREINEYKISFEQIADAFGYFPLRFRIRKSRRYSIRYIPHDSTSCFLC